MNWAQFNDLVSHMCFAGFVVASWSLTQEVAGSSPFNVINFYRPQRSWGKVMFLQVCVILFTGGEYLTRYTPRPGTSPGPGTPPRRRACWEIRSMRGRYASYWNAILFVTEFAELSEKHLGKSTLLLNFV